MRRVSIVLVWSVAALILACSGSRDTGADEGPAWIDDELFSGTTEPVQETVGDMDTATGFDAPEIQPDASGEVVEASQEIVEPVEVVDVPEDELGEDMTQNPVPWSDDHCAGDAPLPAAASWDAVERRVTLACLSGLELRAAFLDAGTVKLHYPRPGRSGHAGVLAADRAGHDERRELAPGVPARGALVRGALWGGLRRPGDADAPRDPRGPAGLCP